MENFAELNHRILTKRAKIGVIGLGYVGLPVACMFADQGFEVVGLDIKQDRVNRINQGECPIEGNEPGLPELLQTVIRQGKLRASTDYQSLSSADIVLIDVETPTDRKNIPQYVALRSACESLERVMQDGILVIVESTIAPGTVVNVVRPILEQNGKIAGTNFHLGACPERVMPGRLLSNLKTMSRVCGGESPDVSQTLILLYQHIVGADLDPADIITAEITKTAENTYRDVNIAFANELAMICQSVGADFLRVRELVNKSPGRNVLLAGAGVGGHCIPKDPWLLAYGAKDQVPLRLIPAARAVNDQMPVFVAEMTAKALQQFGLEVENTRIVVLGYSYLEESDDTRNSPSESLVHYLRARGSSVLIHDPYVSEYNQNLEEIIPDCDAIIVMVAHNVYKNIDLKLLKQKMRTPVLVDGRRAIDPAAAREAGLTYLGIGFGLA